jgi:hypothetical protein
VSVELFGLRTDTLSQPVKIVSCLKDSNVVKGTFASLVTLHYHVTFAGQQICSNQLSSLS